MGVGWVGVVVLGLYSFVVGFGYLCGYWSFYRVVLGIWELGWMFFDFCLLF